MVDPQLEAIIDGATPESAGSFVVITDPVQKQREIEKMFQESIPANGEYVDHEELCVNSASTFPNNHLVVSTNRESFLLEAKEMASTMRERGHNVPTIESVRVIMDGHMTLAVLNQEFIGWAKFNPRDTITWTERSKRGKVLLRTQSKYSGRAGAMRAIRRALKLMTLPNFKI